MNNAIYWSGSQFSLLNAEKANTSDTQAGGENSIKIATTAFVIAAVSGKANTASPTFTGTVSGITSAMVGLGNVTNESKATMFASPTFTGTVTGVTAAMVGLGNVTNENKTTMFNSPTFTGTPVVPTAAGGTNTTQIASTAFVQAALSSFVSVSPSAVVPAVPTAAGAVGVATVYARSDHAHPKETLSGSSTFNSTTGVTVTHNLGNTNYKVAITPTSNAGGYLGEVYVIKSANSMAVHCTGSTTTTTFDYVITK